MLFRPPAFQRVTTTSIGRPIALVNSVWIEISPLGVAGQDG